MKGLCGLLAAAAICGCASAVAAEPAKVVLIAGLPSHGPGDHEHNAGCKLLMKCLEGVPGVEPVLVTGGWPADESVFQGARAVVLYSDGGRGHPYAQQDRVDRILRPLLERGVGLAFLHFAVEVPRGKPGDFLLDAIGGYYETGFSTNPVWVADFSQLPEHPTTRGVRPFTLRDEWYYNIRFRDGMKGVVPILTATPNRETRQGRSSSPRGPYPHIVAADGREEVVSWVVERPDGGRGFGFTGGHFHRNWGNDDFRTLVLNAILWTARVEVPAEGVRCALTEAELKANLDPK